ncbi:EamA family transporter RarD [Aeromicrobium sp.]|uniref:EamA family transporter RarD n=1 Tax=Aeromicrobium sp. TaxID=1871063 RepID=UPI003C340AD0
MRKAPLDATSSPLAEGGTASGVKQPTRDNAVRASRGFMFGLGAYGLWGAFPLYWPLLEPAGAIEILAHRILWSCLTIGAVLLLFRRLPQFLALLRDHRARALLTLAAATISANWFMYIWAVNNERVVEASLGYFINPLVTVLMGIVVLGERLRRMQWVAMSIAVVAVLVLAFDYGRPPWIAMVLACTFGTYGLSKKVADVEAVESLAFEMVLVAPFAAAYLAWLGATGAGNFTAHGSGHTLLLMTTGIVTAIPLLCFGAAAVRVSMVTMGLLQYVTPVLQFLLGVLWFHEDMPVGRWIGFMLIWVALTVFTVEASRHRRRQLRLAATASAL